MTGEDRARIRSIRHIAEGDASSIEFRDGRPCLRVWPTGPSDARSEPEPGRGIPGPS